MNGAENVGGDGNGLVAVLYLRLFDSLLHKLIDGSDARKLFDPSPSLVLLIPHVGM